MRHSKVDQHIAQTSWFHADLIVRSSISVHFRRQIVHAAIVFVLNVPAVLLVIWLRCSDIPEEEVQCRFANDCVLQVSTANERCRRAT